MQRIRAFSDCSGLDRTRCPGVNRRLRIRATGGGWTARNWGGVCSNIAGCVIEMSQSKLNLHDYSRTLREGNSEYAETYGEYAKKYLRDLM